MKRRTFLAVSAAAGAAACSHTPGAQWRTLSDHEAATLEAWCECLIPEDQDAGAKRARVVRFIDIQLTRRDKRFRKHYAAAVEAIEEHARRHNYMSFAEQPLEVRTALLADMEQSGRRDLFNMVLDHSMQGYYGNPRHGGNEDFASWRMMGVPPMPVRGRYQYTIPGQEGKS